MFIQRRKIVANTDVDTAGTVDVTPEATDLLFEAEDVAELVAEVTGEAVEVEVSGTGDEVTFTVGDEEFVVEAEGNEEVLESVRKNFRGKRPVTASSKKTTSGKVIKKFPTKK